MIRRSIGMLATAGLLLALPVAVAHGEAEPGGAPRAVTLITGDRVVTTAGTAAGTAARVEPGRGRTGIRFLTRRVDGHLHVIPSDALPLLITGGPAAAARVTAELPAIGARAVRAARDTTLWAALTAGAAQRRAGGPEKIWLDGLRRQTLDVSVPQVGAPAAWQAGYDGTGSTVAVLDSGIDATHPDLAGRVVARRNFTDGMGDDRDTDGHGTHVASTIAGSGAASGGRYRGVAPGARLLDGKVCFDGKCPESAILAGMQWAVEQGARVVNLSLGSDDTPDTDPLEAAVDALTHQHGVLFVAAAGNDGRDRAVGSPASADAALAVGAVDAADRVAAFSNRGPRRGDGGLKPDITAPGVAITAARSADAPGSDPYTSKDGTSMATPHVAGAAAILRQRHPGWSPAQVKAALMATARPSPDAGVFAQGAGRADVGAAVAATLRAEPASLSLGFQSWPHGDDVPVERTVTYHNAGGTPVRLTLKVETSAPAGMFRLDAGALDVPAGGRAGVTVTADTRVGSTDGPLGGWIVATAGGTTLRTPVGTEREVESYDLTLVHTARDGTPAADGSWSTTLARTDALGFETPYDPDGTVTVRLPRGDYSLVSVMFEDDFATAVMLAQPLVRLTAAQTVRVDARRARPVDIDLARADVEPVAVELQSTVAGGGSFQIPGVTFDGLYSGRLGPARPTDGFWGKVSGTWATPDGADVYTAAYFSRGRLFDGFHTRVAARDLATVRARHLAQGTGSVGEKSLYAAPVDGDVGLAGLALPVTLPSTRTEHYNTDGGARWRSILYEWGEDGFVGETRSSWRTFTAGSTTHEDWNHAVFGPAFGQPAFDHEFVTRTGDTMQIVPSLFGDGAGRSGYARLDSGRLVLARDGVVLADEPNRGDTVAVAVPAGPGRFALRLSARRAAGAPLSTTVDARWTFHSSGNGRVPLLTVSFTPAVDDGQRMPAERRVLVPVAVTAPPGSGAGRPGRPAVEVSFDDGRTWRPAAVVGAGGATAVRLDHPATSGFVSLRARASDDRGNTVEQTVIRAYRI